MPSYIPGGIKLDYDELIINHNGNEFSLAEDYIKTFVRPENFIIAPENILADATNAVQRASDYVSENGGKVLLDKMYLIRELVLKANSAIEGLNKTTCGLKSIHNNLTTKLGLITQLDASQDHIQLKNFTIDGGMVIGTGGGIEEGIDIDGIHLEGDVAGSDLHHTLSDLIVQNCVGNGIYLTGTKETKGYNCNVTQVLKNGFYLGCTDSRFTNLTAFFVGRNGYVVGSNNMLTGCKAFGTGTMMGAESGYGDGFSLVGTASSLSACEAQETGRHGLYLKNICTANEINGIIIDSVSHYDNTGGGKGIVIDGCNHNKITGSVCNRTVLAGYGNQALQINDGSHSNYINITANTDDAGTDPLTYINSDYPVGNEIIINNTSIYESDFEEFSKLNKFDANLVPKGFSESITAGNITTSKSIENKILKVNIDTATSWGTYKLVRYGKCQVGDKINAIFRGYVSDGTKLFLRVELAFYDANLTIIGSAYTNPTGTPNGKSPKESYYNVTAPANAAYYKAFAVLCQYSATATGSGYFVYFDARNRTNTYSDIYTKTFDPPSIASGTVSSTTITIPGAKVSNCVDVGFSILLSGLRMWGEVTADNTVTIYFYNPTAAAVDLASGTLKAKLRYI